MTALRYFDKAVCWFVMVGASVTGALSAFAPFAVFAMGPIDSRYFIGMALALLLGAVLFLVAWCACRADQVTTQPGIVLWRIPVYVTAALLSLVWGALAVGLLLPPN